MTERIKLTEEHFIPCEDKQYGFSMLIRLNTTSYEEFKQLKQQILDEHKIVGGLLHFIKHCDLMIESYESQLKNDNNSINTTQFLQSQIEEWGRKENDLTDLIEYTTKVGLKEYLEKTSDA